MKPRRDDPEPHDFAVAEAVGVRQASSLPDWLVFGGAVSWRLIAIGIVVFFTFRVLRALSVVVIALVVALFLASVLWAPARWLIDRARWPPLVASLGVMVTAGLLLIGIVALVVPAVAARFGDIQSDLGRAWESFREWLTTGPFGLAPSQVDGFLDSWFERMQQVRGESVVGGATAVAEFLAGFFLAAIITFFILKDGRPLVTRFLERLPREQAEVVETGIRIAWKTLSQYMAGVALVGLFDAALIAIGLWIVGVPLIVPLSILVFFGAFFPLVGAFVSGLFAVAVAFVNGGIVDGLIILGVVVVVQQVEGDVILPLVFGKALRLHPLVVLLAVTAGGITFGLFGAFVAVPLVAATVSVRETLARAGDSGYLNLARG